MSKGRLVGKYMRIDKILIEAKVTQWCPIDIHNEFTFNGYNMKVDPSVEQYKVENPPKKLPSGEWNDFTNKAMMDRIFCIDTGDEMRFFDQNLEEIENVLVQQV